MSNRQVFYFLLLVLFAVFLLSVTWEFMLEDTIGAVLGLDTTEEPAKQKWIYVFGGVFFAGVAVIGPILLLQKSANARKRAEELLPSAVENLQECFALFDADDRLIMCNERYRQTHPLGADFFKPGIKFEDIVRTNIRKGNLPDAVGREEEYFRERMERHLNPGKAFLRRYVNGRSYLFNEAATPDGGICVTMTDVTEIKEAEENIRKLNAQLEARVGQRTQDLYDANRTNHLLREIAVAANEAATVEDAVQVCLDEVCDFTGWPVGHAFKVTGPNRIDSMKIWHLDDPEKFEVFRKITHGAHFVSGGLSGRALATGQPYWVKDVGQDKSFQRGKLAADLGVKAGFAFPVLVGKEVVAVLEFYSMEAADPDQALLDVMAQVGTQLGRVVERERADGAVRDSEDRYARAVSGTNDGLWDWNIETGENYFSPRFERILGYDESELEPVLQTFLDLLHPDDRDRTSEAIPAHLEDRVPYDIEYRLRCKDGEYKWLHARGQAIWNERGEATTMAGSISDISERKRAEQAVRESEERTRKILENLADGAITIDSEGTIEYVNPETERIFGYSEDELIGRNVSMLMPEPNRDSHDRYMSNYLKTGKARIIGIGREVTGLRKDGTTFPMELTVSATITEGRTVFTGTLRDMTERKKAEQAVIRAKEEAELANRTKSEFLANISHELRTPLNAIIGFSDTIREQTFGPVVNKKYEEYIDNIYESGQHLLDLINDILDVSAIEAGKLDLDEREMDLADVAEASVRLVRARAEAGRVQLVNTIDHNLPPLFADERRVKQILLNLLTNAVKFTPESGQVTLSARVGNDGCVLVTVSDTGVGMSDEDLIRALTPFGRADSDLAKPQEGTGLGLPVTRGLVEAHGGIFRLVSTPGSGTTVTIRFPPERVKTKTEGLALIK